MWSWQWRAKICCHVGCLTHFSKVWFWWGKRRVILFIYLVLIAPKIKKSVSFNSFCSLHHLRMGKLYKESYANTYAALNVRNALDKLINALQSPCGGRLERRRHNISSTTTTRPAPGRDYTSEFAKCHALVTSLTKPAAASSVVHQLATPRISTTTPKKKPIHVSEPASPPVLPPKFNLTTRLVSEPASPPVIPTKFNLTTRLISEPTSPPVVPTPKSNLASQLEPTGPPETPYSTAAAPIKCSPVVECTTTDPKMTISLPSRDGNESSNCARSVDSGLNLLRNPEQYQGFGTPPPLAGSKSHSNPNPHLNLNSNRGGKRPSSRSSLTSEFSELGAEYACHIPPHLHDQVTTLHQLNFRNIKLNNKKPQKPYAHQGN